MGKQKESPRSLLTPAELTNENLYSEATRIVEEAALDFRSFAAINLSIQDKETTFSQYEKWTFDSPDLFFQAYQSLSAYWTLTESWLNKSFQREGELDKVKKQFKRFPLKPYVKTLKETCR